jgi:prepilin-type N-terminal cleavage/methylation domain-containing protein
MARTSSESGFSLIELLVATCIFLVITGIVGTALRQITNSQTTIWNRTQMHSGVRGATELLQQEVGQAGRVAMPGTPATPGAITTNPGVVIAGAGVGVCNPSQPDFMAVTVPVSSVKGLYATAGASPASYIFLTTLDGANRETVPVYSVDTAANTIFACFNNPHLPGTTLMALGGFATGIVPPNGIANGSTGNVLKMYGDINGDGDMVYVEYTCDTATGSTHKLYRNVMAFNAAIKPPLSDALVLLSNVMDNPGGTPCFTYQTTPAAPPIIVNGQAVVFVLDVAITLTVQTQQIDPITKQFQMETKALLNVSPRNVYSAWQLANYGYTDHIQSTPATVAALLGM